MPLDNKYLEVIQSDFYQTDAASGASEQIQMPSPGKATQNNTCIYKTFAALVNRRQVNISPDVAEHILVHDLHIAFDSLSLLLRDVLKDSLIYLISVWPGWKNSTEYFNGTIPYSEWFGKFRDYLTFQIGYIIKNEAQYQKPKTVGVDVGTVTDLKVKSVKSDSRFALEIAGPPSMLNSLVFYECDNDISIKQLVDKPWVDISLKQLLNWPSCKVSVNLPDISFTRENMHDFTRYLSLAGDVSNCPSVDYVCHIKPSKEQATHAIYSYDFIAEYFKQFSNVCKEIYGADNSNVDNLITIMMEFLNDIRSVDVYNCTMASCCSICYNIGTFKYIRNKKMISNNKVNPRAINFCEILVPKVEFTLHHFTAEQAKTGDSVSFQSLNDLLLGFKLGLTSNYLMTDCVTYACTFCAFEAKGFEGKQMLMTHLQEIHKSEQAVLCFSCRQEFDISCLAKNRWNHVCKTA